jgi:hypothetical protein
MNTKDTQKDKALEDKLNKYVSKDCGNDEECLMKQQEEIVQRESKKIITNDGRQLLSEYTV